MSGIDGPIMCKQLMYVQKPGGYNPHRLAYVFFSVWRMKNELKRRN